MKLRTIVLLAALGCLVDDWPPQQPPIAPNTSTAADPSAGWRIPGLEEWPPWFPLVDALTLVFCWYWWRLLREQLSDPHPLVHDGDTVMYLLAVVTTVTACGALRLVWKVLGTPLFASSLGMDAGAVGVCIIWSDIASNLLVKRVFTRRRHLLSTMGWATSLVVGVFTTVLAWICVVWASEVSPVRLPLTFILYALPFLACLPNDTGIKRWLDRCRLVWGRPDCDFIGLWICGMVACRAAADCLGLTAVGEVVIVHVCSLLNYAEYHRCGRVNRTVRSGVAKATIYGMSMVLGSVGIRTVQQFVGLEAFREFSSFALIRYALVFLIGALLAASALGALDRSILLQEVARRGEVAALYQFVIPKCSFTIKYMGTGRTVLGVLRMYYSNRSIAWNVGTEVVAWLLVFALDRLGWHSVAPDCFRRPPWMYARLAADVDAMSTFGAYERRSIREYLLNPMRTQFTCHAGREWTGAPVSARLSSAEVLARVLLSPACNNVHTIS